MPQCNQNLIFELVKCYLSSSFCCLGINSDLQYVAVAELIAGRDVSWSRSPSLPGKTTRAREEEKHAGCLAFTACLGFQKKNPPFPTLNTIKLLIVIRRVMKVIETDWNGAVKQTCYELSEVIEWDSWRKDRPNDRNVGQANYISLFKAIRIWNISWQMTWVGVEGSWMFAC